MFPGFSTRFKLEMDACYRNYLKKADDDDLKIDINVKVISFGLMGIGLAE
jgi:hypothetical protein